MAALSGQQQQPKTPETVIEILTKESYSRPESLSRPSTSSSVRTVSQLSLEHLPPEAPYFSIRQTHPESTHSENFAMEGSTKREELSIEEVASPEDLTPRREELSTEGVEPVSVIDEEESAEEMQSNVELSSHEFYDRILELSDSIQHRIGEELRTRPSDHTHVSTTHEAEEKSVPDASTSAPPSDHASPPSRCSTSKSQFDDPKVQRAYEKMIRLDERLAGLSKREREVKRQRRQLEEEMERMGAGQAVTLHSGSSRHCRAVSPVFPTQPSDSGFSRVDIAESEDTLKDVESEEGFKEGEGLEGRKGRKRKKEDSESSEDRNDGEGNAGTNFIQRNIELVSDAGALVMMTKAEKQRLEELMAEDDQQDDMQILDIKDSLSEDSRAVCSFNKSVSAFSLPESDQARLRELDSQLEAILPMMRWDPSSCNTGAMGDGERGGAEGGMAREEEGGVDESWREENDASNNQAEILQHPHIYNDVYERERLRVIEERLRQIQCQNQANIERAYLDESTVKSLIKQCEQEQQIGDGKLQE